MKRRLPTAVLALLLVLGWQHGGCARTILVKRTQLPDRERLVVSGLAPSVHVMFSSDIVDVSCPSDVDRVNRIGISGPYLDGVALIRGHLLLLLKPGVSASRASQLKALAFDLTKAHFPDQQASPSEGISRRSGSEALPGSRQGSSRAALALDHALVPGLPSPFLATVEGQVSKLIATPLPVDVRKVVPRLPTITSAGTTGPTRPINDDGSASAIGRSILWPVPSSVGVAALRRDDQIIVYFDSDRPIDPSGRTDDPALRRLQTEVVGGATLVRLPVPASTPFWFEHVSDGWRLTLGEDHASRAAMRIVTGPNRLLFPNSSPGTSFPTRDPVSGATLLVGTVRRDCGELYSGSGSALFAILPTECGVVVDARSDRIVLRTTTRGFSLEAGDGGALDVSRRFAAQPTGARSFTHVLRSDPTTSIAELAQRLRAELRAAAASPDRARLRPRLDAAETMVKLGLDREARALTTVASADDPASGTDERLSLLRSITVLGDPAAADRTSIELADGKNDEVRLWAALGQSPNCSRSKAAAQIVRNELPLLLSYPIPLRSIAAGAAASCFLADGTPDDLRAVGRLPDERTTAVARAVALDRLGDPKSALDDLDRLAHDSDALVRANAELEDADIRGRTGRLSPVSVADLLEAHRLDWRAIGREPEARLAEAQWRLQAHQTRRAFAIWQDIARHDQAWRGAALSAIADALAALGTTGENDAMPAADYVAIADENAPLLATRPDLATRILPIVAEKRAARGRARPAAETSGRAASLLPPGRDRSTLLVRSAELRVDAGDTDQARSTLASLPQDDTAPSVLARAAVVRARILQSEGKPADALVALGDAGDLAPPSFRATLLANNDRWHDARSLLEPLVARLPASGALPPASSDLVLQLATAALRDDRGAEVGALLARFSGRFADRKGAEALAVLAGTVPSEGGGPVVPREAD